MQFDAGSLVSSFLISGTGFVLFAFGKRMGRPPQLLAGIVLMVYPYFVSNLALMWAIALVLWLSVWLAVRAGM